MFEFSVLFGAGMPTRVSVLGSIVKFEIGGKIISFKWWLIIVP